MLFINNVSKSFGSEKVLEHLQLELRKGEIFGLLGRNGSGKTTVLRLIQQILLPDEGEIVFEDKPIHLHPEVKQKILYVPVRQPFYDPFNYKQIVRMLKSIYPNFDVTYANELINRYHLPENKPFRDFSTGMKKQFSIILAFAARPSVILLDEPTDGIDAVTRHDILQLMVEETAERETTMLITSHRLEDIERICNRIGMLQNNTISDVMDLDEMKGMYSKIQAVFEDDVILKIREKGIPILDHAGVFYTMVLRKDDQEKRTFLKNLKPKVWHELPVNLEEVFIAKFGGNRRW